MKLRHFLLGMAVWLTAIVAGYLVTRAELDEQSSSVADLATDIQQWVAGARQSATAESTFPLFIALDDPIFIASQDDRFRQVGHVSSVDGTRKRDPIEVIRVAIVVYNDAVKQFPHGYHLVYHNPPKGLDWLVKTMVPDERRREIVEVVRTEWEKHQRAIMAQLEPVLREGVRRAVKSVEKELPRIIRNHRDEFQHLGDRLEAEILQEELVPLVRDEIFPLIQEEVQPVAMDIGKSLWNRVSLLSFTWRYLYDVSPLPERNAVRAEFQRFIDREAVPELEARTDEFIDVTKTIIKRVARNERVRDAFRNNIQRVAQDQELQDIVGEIVREATIDNVAFRREFADYWNSRETRIALRIATKRLGTMVEKIQDLIFGTRDKGITAEYSRVIRAEVLKKDRRWFVMVPNDGNADSGTIKITEASGPMSYPLQFAGQHQSPLTPESSRDENAIPAEE